MRDDGLKVLALLLEQLSQLVVFFDLVLSVDLDDIALLLGLFEFCSLSMWIIEHRVCRIMTHALREEGHW